MIALTYTSSISIFVRTLDIHLVYTLRGSYVYRTQRSAPDARSRLSLGRKVVLARWSLDPWSTDPEGALTTHGCRCSFVVSSDSQTGSGVFASSLTNAIRASPDQQRLGGRGERQGTCETDH